MDGNRGVGNEREGEIKGTFLGEKEKKGKGEEVRMGVARRGMARMSGKISGKKKEMTGGKERETAEVHAVLTGEDCCTYVRVLERISQYNNESYRISFSNV